MPCDQIVQSRVDFLSTSTDIALLAEGLQSLGFTVTQTESGLSFSKYGTSGTFNKASGRLASSGRQELDTDEVKRGYSKAVVNSQAKRMGWKLNWKLNDNGEEETFVEKRI